MSTYLIKEIFGPTIQGEGAHAGRACVFLRFARCNLACDWCDTDFSKEGAERLTANEIVQRLLAADTFETRLVIVTGGEPSLYWDQALAKEVLAAGFRIHMESNGTQALKGHVHWLTVSPKPQFHGPAQTLDSALCPNECKVVVDRTVNSETLHHFERVYASCEHWFLQPCDNSEYAENLRQALSLQTESGRWRIGVQLHKVLGVP